MDLKCQVEVKEGVLQGKIAKTYNGKEYYSFEGIPYAQPPIGELRFQAAVPPKPWTGVRDATKPGNRCAQMDPYRPSQFQGSEDCLYLNVYTPALNKKKKIPVIVYVHGGRYIVGYGDYYKPDFLLQKDVIVVSINYRLHIFGFLCLHTAEVPGNVGLKDVVAALRWVKGNIGRFGGDPDNVTVFGESAGSGTVSALLVSEMADNLFHKAIMESGSCLSDLFMKIEDKIAKANYIVQKLGVETDDVNKMHEVLKNASTEDLVKCTVEAQNSHSDINAFFMPVIEREFKNVEPFFLEDPWVLYRTGKIKNIPIIFGIMSHEGAYFINRDTNGHILYDNNLENFIPRNMGIPKGTRRSIIMGEILRSYYFGGAKVDDTKKELFLDFVSDSYFSKVLTLTVDYISRVNPNVWYFRFAYEGNLNTRLMSQLGLKGATHGDALPYQFYRKNKMDKCTDKDLEVIELFTDAITSFVKTGKPSLGSQKTSWQPFEEKTRMCLDISDEFKVIPYPGNERVNLWIRLMNEKSRL